MSSLEECFWWLKAVSVTWTLSWVSLIKAFYIVKKSVVEQKG